MAGTDRTVEFLPLVAGAAASEDGRMFTIDCPTHRSAVLLSERRIRGIRRSSTGVDVDYECWCGHRGSFAAGRPPLVGRHRPAR
jgi:hypothetical protein